jgi:hypothetical protein
MRAKNEYQVIVERLRQRAAHYRALAENAITRDKQATYHEIAVLLEHEADAIRDEGSKRN